jgi:hypothetical protein
MGFAKTGAMFFAAACLILGLVADCQSAPEAKPAVAAGDTAKVEKKRVLKETASPTTRKGDSKDSYAAKDEDEEGFFSSCLGSCLGEMIGSMFGSICGGSSSGGGEHVVVRGTGIPGDGSVPAAMKKGKSAAYFGTVASADMQGDSVEVWNMPGGGAAGGWVLNAVASGTDVAATQFKFYEDELWVRIESEGEEPIDGWIREKEIGIQQETAGVAREGTTGDRSFEPSSAPGADRDRPRWHARANFFYPEFSSKEISDEYKNSCWGAGVETGLFLTRSINVGVLFDYVHANGAPLYKYIGGTLTDWPLASDLDVLHFGARFGQLLRLNAWYFEYGVGPAVFHVKESASIAVYDGLIRQGTRTDELSAWKFGASGGIGTGWLAGGIVPLGLSIRFSWIPWEGEREKSLTLDYLEDDSIFMVHLGISVGYLSF